MIFDFNSPENKISIQSVGGKYYHLYFLNRIEGINIPDAFCISSVDYDVNEVQNRIDSNKRYAVRSSSVQEDLAGKSAAGIFESFLDIKGDQHIHQKIQECFLKINSARSNAYHKTTDEKLKICVIIQEMVQPELSGVLFTKNPLSAAEEYHIQITKGRGDKLVSGMVNPETVILHKNEKTDDPLLKSLSNATSLIERNFKSDLDIEWAWKDNRLYILQARPMSHHIESTDPANYWTRANIGEIIPKPLTPLSWSIFKDVIFNSYRIKYYSLMDRFFTNFIHLISRKPPKTNSPKMFNGYLYLNMETIFKVFGSEPWVSTEILQAALGFTVPEMFKDYKPDSKDKIYTLIKKWIYILELIFPWISMERRVLKFVQTQIPKIEKKKPDHNIDKIVRFVFGWHLAVTARGFSHLGFIYKYLKKFQKLESPLPHIIGDLDTPGHFHSTRSSRQDIIKDNYLENTSRQNKQFFNDFELAVYNSNDERNDIKNTYNPDIDLFANRDDSINKQSRFYSYLLNKLRTSILRREQLKSILISEYRKYRSIYLEKAEVFLKDKRIGKVDDIFYFQKEEIDNNLDNINIEKIVAERKKIFIEQSLNRAPVSFFGDEPILSPEIDDSQYDHLKGIGCSRGVISGFVKIMNTTDQKVNLDNSILITKFADPGWTPHLLKSKGMITEVGGILSHLATIARENKIPFIVGVENATQLLKDNQEIKIDGQTGFVQLIN